MPPIHHDPVGHRLEACFDGARCVLEYRLDGARMTITHTWVPVPVRGRGHAATLVAAAFELARAEGWRVVPACSYAAMWLARHPEMGGLAA